MICLKTYGVAIVGSRGYPNLSEVEKHLDELGMFYASNLSIITGGAKGVDKVAEDWAKKRKIPCEIIRPIDPTNRLSYLFRNVEIITKSNIVVAFWDGKSKGTKFVIDYCKARGHPIVIKKGKT